MGWGWWDALDAYANDGNPIIACQLDQATVVIMRPAGCSHNEAASVDPYKNRDLLRRACLTA